MAVHKKYQYRVLRAPPMTSQTADQTEDQSLEDEMNKLGLKGWRHVATLQAGPRVIMELESISTDEGTPGAFQRAGLRTKGRK